MKRIANGTRLLILSLGLLLLASCGGSESQDKGASKGSAAKATAASEKSSGAKPGHKAEEAKIKLTEAEAQAAALKIAAIEEQEVVEPLIVTATIQANQDRLAHVAPRVPSRIISISAKLGDRVRQGQTLAMLDSMDLGEAHSNYTKVRTEAALARANFERLERLYKEQIVPQKDFLRARAEFQTAEAAVHAAADRLRLLGVKPEALKSGAAFSVFPLVSPFSGTVTEKHAILGELAQPDKSLFTVTDLSVVWIEGNLFERDLSKVSIGSRALVTVTAYPNEKFEGRLAYISSALDKESRTLQARIEVANGAGKLRPEMFATAAIDTPSRARAMLVPDEAVVLMQGQPTVFIQSGDGFEARAVETGEKLGGRLALKSGLKGGENVVVSGAYALKAKVLKSQIGDAE